MTLTISILVLLSLATTLIILLAKRVNQQLTDRGEFIHKLKEAFPDLKVIENETSSPTLEFSNGTDHFKLYKGRKTYVKAHDEFVEIAVKDESKLPLLKKKVEKFLDCNAVIEDNWVKAKIPGLKDYDRLFNFIQHYKHEDIY